MSIKHFIVSSLPLLLVHCGGVPEDTSAGLDDLEPSHSEQALSNGSLVDETNSGHLALEFWSSSDNNYRTFCSATLIYNDSALTAQHCLGLLSRVHPGVNPETDVYARMGSQRVRVNFLYTNPVVDVAFIGLASPLQIMNNDGVVSYSGYARGIYTVSAAQMNGASFTCYGHGPAGVGTRLTRSTFKAEWDGRGDGLKLNPTGSGRIEASDSGGGCLAGTHPRKSPMAIIISSSSGASGFGNVAGPAFDAAPWVFSTAGIPAGYSSCLQITEPSDPNTWEDNYLCGRTGTALPSISWSNAGPYADRDCTQIHEPSDPDTWDDNYLCASRSSGRVLLYWSNAGPLPGKRCIQWYEASEPAETTWYDNYLCWL